eukprot:SM000001S04685  [mRNA]  locus=s1:1635029:1636365:- [translate_table: standard]
MAAEGFLALAVDVYRGGPFVPAADSDFMAAFSEWKSRQDMEKQGEDAAAVVAALRSEEGVAKVGLCGFCWGAKVAALAAKRAGAQALTMCHPSATTVDDIEGLTMPTAILGAEIDKATPPSLAKEFEDILQKNGITNFVKIFPKVSHGWTMRYNEDNEEARQAAHEAYCNAIAFFKEHLMSQKGP